MIIVEAVYSNATIRLISKINIVLTASIFVLSYAAHTQNFNVNLSSNHQKTQQYQIS